MTFDTPIALLTFARPDTTAQVLDAIRAVKPRTLLFVSDGPREGRPTEAKRVAETRSLLSAIDWPCDVRTNFAERNMGCRRRVSSGLDWVFGEVDRAIVLEDDCLPSPDFFPFCAELLDRYADDHRIMSISGTNCIANRYTPSTSYFLSRYPSIWGWATWRRAWKGYDVDLTDWPERRGSGWLRDALDDRVLELRFAEQFDALHNGFDTWDGQLTYHALRMKALTAIPALSLVRNIGFGDGATHSAGSAPRYVREMTYGALDFPLTHPIAVSRDPTADRHIENATRLRPRLKRRWSYWARALRQSISQTS